MSLLLLPLLAWDVRWAAGAGLVVGSVSDPGGVERWAGEVYSGGPLALLLSRYCEKHNTSYRLVQPQDNQYGVELGGGQFSGVMGQVQRGEVSLGGGLFSMMEERMRVVEFSASLGVEENTILMQNVQQDNVKDITSPFQPLGQPSLDVQVNYPKSCFVLHSMVLLVLAVRSAVSVWVLILSSSALMVSAMWILICRLQSHLQDQYSLAQLVWWTPPSHRAIT